MRVVLSRRAHTDLRNIWHYTATHWSEEQADRYVAQVHDTLAALAQNSFLGSGSEELGPDYRKHRAGSHVIFFRREADIIRIVRVLHQSMDFKRHL